MKQPINVSFFVGREAHERAVAANTVDPAARAAHERLADAYARRIRELIEAAERTAEAVPSS